MIHQIGIEYRFKHEIYEYIKPDRKATFDML